MDIKGEDGDLIRFKIAKKDEELSEKLIQDVWGEFEIKDISFDRSYGGWMKVTLPKSAALQLIRNIDFRVRIVWEIINYLIIIFLFLLNSKCLFMLGYGLRIYHISKEQLKEEVMVMN